MKWRRWLLWVVGTARFSSGHVHSTRNAVSKVWLQCVPDFILFHSFSQVNSRWGQWVSKKRKCQKILVPVKVLDYNQISFAKLQWPIICYDVTVRRHYTFQMSHKYKYQ
jgi:hypothetical protein